MPECLHVLEQYLPIPVPVIVMKRVSVILSRKYYRLTRGPMGLNYISSVYFIRYCPHIHGFVGVVLQVMSCVCQYAV